MGDIYAKIIGHDAIKHGLLHAVATKHLHHALLFMGQAGVGKSTMARNRSFANYRRQIRCNVAEYVIIVFA